MLYSKKLKAIVTKLFIRSGERKIFLFVIRQSYFAAPQNIKLNFTHCFIMKIPNKQELNINSKGY